VFQKKKQFTKQFNIYYLFIYITESSAYIGLKISKQQRAQSTNAEQHLHSMQYIALACMNHDARCTQLAELFAAQHNYTTYTSDTIDQHHKTNNLKQVMQKWKSRISGIFA
jgi:hypothetical protein